MLRRRPPLAARRAAVLVVALGGLLAGCGGRDGAADPEASPPTTGAPAPTTTTSLAAGVQVDTAEGPVVGNDEGDSRTFFAIPYAAAPVGPLRFAPPQPAPVRDEPLDATAPGAACVQAPQGSAPVSEDCLVLDVTTPNPPRPDRPVLVWVHPGSFVSGRGADWDARGLAAEHDVVVVTINHRLGVLGFLAHPELSTEAADGASGNQGLDDQRAALRWVRSNVAGFGGDPGNVTLAGQSSGASSGCFHSVSPASEGLFDRLVLQSGVCSLTGQRTPTLEHAERSGVAIAEALGCPAEDAAPCLRAATPEQLDLAVEEAGLAAVAAATPIVDGTSLPDQPADLLAEDAAADVPVLIGSTRDEATVFVYDQIARTGRAPTPAQYEAILASAYGPGRAAELVAAHPLASYRSTAQALAAVRTDQLACSVDDLATAYAGVAPTFRYELADRTVPLSYPATDLDVGAAHGSDLIYLFGRLTYPLAGSNPADLTPAQQHVADQMTTAWTAFAAEGDPNADGVPTWPAADPDDDRRLVFTSTGGRLVDGFRQEHRCEVWPSP